MMANLPHITRFGLPGIDRSLSGCTPVILIANATSSSQRDIGAWLRHYNEVWPHSSLGYLAPAESIAKSLQRPSRQLAGTLRYIGHSQTGPLHHLRREAA
jgi:hypothetical protein